MIAKLKSYFAYDHRMSRKPFAVLKIIFWFLAAILTGVSGMHGMMTASTDNVASMVTVQSQMADLEKQHKARTITDDVYQKKLQEQIKGQMLTRNADCQRCNADV
jgi:hypothetical protein